MKIKVNLIGGFLGSGKTTLLRHFLSTPKLPEKVAILVNELGEIGIDGRVLAEAGGNMVELANGCICCQISGDMVTTLVKIADEQKPDRIMIESTGIAEPGKILQMLFTAEPLIKRMRVEPTVIVVDIAAYSKFKEQVEYHYVMQIKSADIVLMNKIDLVDKKTLKRVEKEISELSPRAFVVQTKKCEVDLLSLLEGRSSLFDPSAEEEHDHEHSDSEFESFVIVNDDVYDRGKVEKYLSRFPENVFRFKGFIKTKDGKLLVNFTAGITEFEEITKKEWPGKNNLILIGRNLDEKKLKSGLSRCKVTVKKKTKKTR